jgi:hypothetical protein
MNLYKRPAVALSFVLAFSALGSSPKFLRTSLVSAQTTALTQEKPWYLKLEKLVADYVNATKKYYEIYETYYLPVKDVQDIWDAAEQIDKILAGEPIAFSEEQVNQLNEESRSYNRQAALINKAAAKLDAPHRLGDVFADISKEDDFASKDITVRRAAILKVKKRFDAYEKQKKRWEKRHKDAINGAERSAKIFWTLHNTTEALDEINRGPAGSPLYVTTGGKFHYLWAEGTIGPMWEAVTVHTSAADALVRANDLFMGQMYHDWNAYAATREWLDYVMRMDSWYDKDSKKSPAQRAYDKKLEQIERRRLEFEHGKAAADKMVIDSPMTREIGRLVREGRLIALEAQAKASELLKEANRLDQEAMRWGEILALVEFANSASHLAHTLNPTTMPTSGSTTGTYHWEYRTYKDSLGNWMEWESRGWTAPLVRPPAPALQPSPPTDKQPRVGPGNTRNP